MRIAYFVGAYPYYSETFVLHQLKLLLDNGHDVCVFAETLAEAIHGAPPVTPLRLEEMPSHPVRRLFSLLMAFLRQDLPISRPLLHSLNFFRFGLDALSLRLAWSVWRAGDNAPFDIICAHFGPRGRRAALLRETGAIQGKLVTVMHGEDISSYPRRFTGQIYAPLFASGDLFLAVSEYGGRKLEILGCPANRLAVQRMGVDTNLFIPGDASTQKLVILTVARFVAYKGLHSALASLAQVACKFEYHLMGDGPLRESLQWQVQELGLHGRVTFVGVKPALDIRLAMQASDIFLLPSETQSNGDEEGIPVAIMEAMACGLPIVSTRHAGIPELIDDGVEGFLVPERDTGALAAAIERLAASPEMREKMGKAGRKRILRQYDSAAQDEQLLRTLEGLL